MKFGMGQRVSRVEDRRFLTGGGRFTDDINLAGQAYGVVLRSPLARAHIRHIDHQAAGLVPGVLEILTGADVAEAGLGHLPCLAATILPLARPDGSAIYVPPRPILVRDQVAFVGDYVAFVIAESPAAARDAAELIQVDYHELPANTARNEALAPGAPVIWPDCGDNICFAMEMGEAEAVARQFAKADHVIEFSLPISRIAMNPMEPRAALGAYDPHSGRYTLYSGCQNPHDIRQLFAEAVFKIPQADLRVVSPDMGGAFGMRSTTFPEMALVLWAAKRLGRPVKWTADRSESFLCDDHGRDMELQVSLALAKDGEFLALKVSSVAAMGAYLSIFGPFPAFGNMGGLAGVYRTPAITAKVLGIFTNATPIGPYRGAGRPEAILALESAIDQAASEMGLDRIELRRRNIIPANAMPYKTGLSYTYDSGAFETNMDRALALAEQADFATRRWQSQAKGRLRGLGIANAIEQSAGLFDEAAELSLDADGIATVRLGTHSHGQGHETVFRQLLHDKLGLDFDQVRYLQGDTDRVPYGHGSFGARSSGLGGAALARAADLVIEKGKALAAHLLETAVQDIEFKAGGFWVSGTDRQVTLAQVARAANSPGQRPAGMDAGLGALASHTPTAPTFPNGCHVCEVEIDPETGRLAVVRYVVVADVGTVMNPMLLEGQVHGGVVQGLGQIVMEEIAWDPSSGQLLTGSFMDYAMPRADDVPFFKVETNPVPSPSNPLGIKGAGESGTVGAMPAVTNAINDALRQAGARPVTMPATSEKIWRTLSQQKQPKIQP